MATKQVMAPGFMPGLPFSDVVKAGDTLYTAGMAGIDPETGKVVDGGVREQTRQTMENLKAGLERAGSSLEDAVKTTVYITDAANYQAMNEVYREYFPDDPPARATVITGLALEELLVEIELIAAA